MKGWDNISGKLRIVGRFVLELVIVFLGVYLAFLFADHRDERKDRRAIIGFWLGNYMKGVNNSFVVIQRRIKLFLKYFFSCVWLRHACGVRRPVRQRSPVRFRCQVVEMRLTKLHRCYTFIFMNRLYTRSYGYRRR